jgi:hypothetical protein
MLNAATKSRMHCNPAGSMFISAHSLKDLEMKAMLALLSIPQASYGIGQLMPTA